jgi:hypothetical protein
MSSACDTDAKRETFEVCMGQTGPVLARLISGFAKTATMRLHATHVDGREMVRRQEWVLKSTEATPAELDELSCGALLQLNVIVSGWAIRALAERVATVGQNARPARLLD